MKKTDLEKRMYKRVAIEVSLRYLLPMNTFDKVYTASTFDIGKGGIGLTCDEALEDGTAMVIEIDPKQRDLDQPAFRVQAQCIWCEPKDGKFQIGVMFYYFDDDLRTQVSCFVDAIDSMAAFSA